MRKECEVVRDILPLYADEVCSETSRELVEEHLQECAACREMLNQLRETEIESRLTYEKDNVIQYALKRFKRRSAAVGSLTSGLFMIPILVCLVINLIAGSAMGWFFIVLAALAVAASLIIVQDDAAWIPLFSRKKIYVTSERLEGFTNAWTGGFYAKLPKMSVKELLNSDSFEFAKDELSEQEDDTAQTIAAEPAQEKRDFSPFSL